MQKIQIPLTPEIAKWLIEKAAKEHRHPRDQVLHILVEYKRQEDKEAAAGSDK